MVPLCVLGDYLGGEAYWAGGLHLYTPLPFRPGKGGFGDLFRTHFFLNAGNLCNLSYGGWTLSSVRFSFFFLPVSLIRLPVCGSFTVRYNKFVSIWASWQFYLHFFEESFFSISCYCLTEMMPWICSVQVVLHHCSMLCCAGDGPRAHLQKLAECIRWSYGAGIVLRLGNIARLELNYCVPMGVQSGDRWGSGAIWLLHFTGFRVFIDATWEGHG